ncbi:MAG: isochorismatase family protein [Candidatus Sumerlaeia bacterium]|nr:isochorismatase family protein [Candidatus Sumerlaeia bacterium]
MGRNPYTEKLTADNSAMLLIDHQTGTMLGVQDIRLDQFRSNVLALARTAKAHRLPTVLTASYAEGPNGPLMPELLEMFPEAPVVYRPGPIDSFDDPNFVAAVEKTGRRKLIMAGVTTDVCLYFPVMSALARGYDVWAVYDASGCWDTMSELTSCMRMSQAGAIVCNWAVITAMLQADWRRGDVAPATLEIFGQHLPFYGMLANNQQASRRGNTSGNGG